MSMTREEAIELLRETPIDIRSTREDDIYTLYATAQMMAIDALRPVSREQVEKVWRGKWELVRRMAASIECKCPKCQRTVIFAGKPANFCEKCGSANTDEAVQMVMERLEALRDE